ncbi:TrkA C-terminal domain-containing protein [Paenisporosarcina sp. TG20]|uniref:TrkA C-terminal domain-containing protein n=1 Tax=Paenisporosarcina sp. TG20 TaxID=1211706 RepID=UPI00350EF414
MISVTSISSPFAGQLIQTIGLPKKTVISAIIRKGDLVMPTGRTKLQKKDILYILTAKDQVANVKLVLADELMK